MVTAKSALQMSTLIEQESLFDKINKAISKGWSSIILDIEFDETISFLRKAGYTVKRDWWNGTLFSNCYRISWRDANNKVENTTPQNTMEAQEALKTLCDYFLGEDYYIADPVLGLQANAIIVAEIMNRYKGVGKRGYSYYYGE